MRSSLSRRIYMVVGVFSLLAVAAAGTALGTSRGTSRDDRSLSRLAPATLPLLPATRQDLLSALASRLDVVRNPRVVEMAIPGESPGLGTKALVLEYELAVPSFEGRARVEADWRGELFTGAVADEYTLRGFGQIRGARATLVMPDGRVRPIGGGVALVPREQTFAEVPADITQTVQSRAPLFGLRDVEVSVIHPLQTAVMIRATSDNPKRDVEHLRQRGGIEALIRRPADDFEGTYLEIDNIDRSAMYIAASAPRNGVGVVWANPALGIRVGHRAR